MISQLLNHMKQRKQLINAFKLAGIYNTFKTENGERKVFPKIHNVPNDEYNYFVFTLPNGVDPKLIKKNSYVFQQVFGSGATLEGDHKRFTLRIMDSEKISKVDYDFEMMKEKGEKEKIIIPIVCGQDAKDNFHIYDATTLPNLLIFGEPGSGKSSILHVINTTLIRLFSPDQMEFYYADFKQTELNVYEGVKHVKSVCYTTKELMQVLKHLKCLLDKRGELLRQHKVRHINSLPDGQKPPYIVLCIDEFVMIDDETVMRELLQIASLGRAYGIYLILSMQRPSHKILSTDVRALLSVRMGFRTVDKRNAMLGETPGSETIAKKGEEGTFFLKMDELTKLRSPYLNEEKTEKILEPYKIDNWKNHNYKVQEPKEDHKKPEPPKESDVFNDVKQPR